MKKLIIIIAIAITIVIVSCSNKQVIPGNDYVAVLIASDSYKACYPFYIDNYSWVINIPVYEESDGRLYYFAYSLDRDIVRVHTDWDDDCLCDSIK